MRELEAEKQRIERKHQQLMHEKSEEGAEWETKISTMQTEHSEVVNKLEEVNECYKQQVDENENLKVQLENM
jgi:hypothetical protein